MTKEFIESLIIWGPTILFALSLGFYFLVGVLRGLRKSVIFLIHTTASMALFVILFFSIVNSENVDVTMVNIVNYVMNLFGTSIQNVLGVSEELTTMKDIILELVLRGMSEEQIFYYVFIDAGAYISTVIELIYRMVLAFIFWIGHVILVLLLTIIYHIFYPVRRKARRYKKAFEEGDASEPYKKRRLMGGVVGVARGLIANVIMLSFVGCLLFIVTGKNNPLPDRKEGTVNEITFGDDSIIGNITANDIYDYYSYICEMSDTGIFGVLNSIKDKDNVPYYFFICDTILQGKIEDENLGISDTFYVREEFASYFGFVKDAAALIIKYAKDDAGIILTNEGNARLSVLTEILKDEDFIKEFNLLIEEFEAEPFIINLSLSILTSFVNHIDLVLGEDSKVTKLIQKVFNPETGIKVTDLATEEDIKGLFTAVVSLASTALNDMQVEVKARQALEAELDLKSFDIKLAFKYGAMLIDEIQALSLFNDRKDVGNKLFKNVYEFCAEELIEDKMNLPQIPENSWVDEFNILFDSVEPILVITAEIFDQDMNVLIANVFNMFEGENGEMIEQEFDKLVSQLTKSSLLDIVFKSTVPGSTIDGILQNMTGNVEATMPKKFTIGSTETEKGELEILLTVIKDFIKNDGASIYELITDGVIDENDLRKIFELLDKDLDENPDVDVKLIDKLLESKILRYFLSAFVNYMNLGDVRLYVTDSAAEQIQEVVEEVNSKGEVVLVTKTYNIIKKEELSILFDFIFSQSDFIFDLLGGNEINFIEVLTSDEIVDLMKESNLLKGIIASVFISVTKEIDLIVLPKGYDDPERWLIEKEIETLVDTIITLKDEKTQSGESLFSSLLGGNIDIGTILDLSGNVIRELYKSKVLKYTVSNALTSFSDTDFAIVIPAVVCEIKNAPTTVPGKTVNIVSADELVGIFEQISNLVDIDGSSVNVKYSSIFNNKADILESYTIQATIMNLLLSMSGGEDSFIAVLSLLQDEYDKFIVAESIEDLANNKWFKSSNVTLAPEDAAVKDDELYLLFDAIQALLGDEYKTKDENGNEIISDDFSLDNIGDSIKIQKSSISKLTSSFVLNATLTNTISASFATPLSALENGVIKKDELEKLLDSLFIILNKREADASLTLDEVQDISIDSIRITRNDIDNYHKNSEIFMTALSSMITEVENVYVPVDATIEIAAIENNKEIRVNRILDYSITGDEDNEFDNLLDCLFDFLGKEEEGTDDIIIDLNDFSDVSDFTVTEENIPVIVSSKIFAASISVILCEDDILVVPEKADNGDVCTELVDLVNEDYDKYIITQEELGNTLSSLVEIFGNTNQETGLKELGLEIDLSKFIITEAIINKIVASAILSATISDYIVDNNIGVVPNIGEVIENIDIISQGIVTKSFRIRNEELNSFMNVSLVLLGSENETTGEFELNINDINLSNFVISNENVGYLDDSYIINATITKELAKLDSLVVPVQSNGEDITMIHPVIKQSTNCATIIDIVPFMEDMLDCFGGSINPSNMSTFEITLSEEDDLEGILWATFAKQLIDNESILIPYGDGSVISTVATLGYDDINGTYSKSTSLVSYDETNSFKNSLIRVLSETSVLTINLNDGVKTEQMEFGPEDISDDDGIFASSIFSATVAKSVLELDSLTVPSVVKVEEQFYGRYELSETLTIDEIKALFNSLFVSTNGEKIKINDFKTENMTFPTDRDRIGEMLSSLIVSATMSNQIINKSEGSIVVLEKVITDYDDYNVRNESYIYKEELINLIHSLTKGLGKTNVNDLKFDQVEIPTSENVDILIRSELVRATISREIMAQESGISVEASVCEVNKVHNSNDKVMCINEGEIKALIIGLEALNDDESSTSNGNFDHITVSIDDLRNSEYKAKAVAGSSVLRSILSTTLKQEINGIPYYRIIGMSEPSEMLVYKSFIVSDNPIYDTLFTKEMVSNLGSLGRN